MEKQKDQIAEYDTLCRLVGEIEARYRREPRKNHDLKDVLADNVENAYSFLAQAKRAIHMPESEYATGLFRESAQVIYEARAFFK